jgi:large subunit ribosomal protein L25
VTSFNPLYYRSQEIQCFAKKETIMSSDFTLVAEARNDLGKGASRRLRRLANLVPAIIYGGDQDPKSISLRVNEVAKAVESEAFFASMVTLDVDGTSETVVVKDMQRHPAKEFVMHIDFLRVDKNTKIVMHVPLHFINEESCPGVKNEGGTITHSVQDIEISCLPADLPEYIEVDLGALNVGDNIHLSDLSMPKGAESVALSHGEDHDLLVAAVQAARVETEETADDAEAPAAESGEGESEEAGEE